MNPCHSIGEAMSVRITSVNILARQSAELDLSQVMLNRVLQRETTRRARVLAADI